MMPMVEMVMLKVVISIVTVTSVEEAEVMRGDVDEYGIHSRRTEVPCFCRQ